MLISPPTTDVGSHNPPPSGPIVLAGIRFLLQSMWDPSIHPPLEPNVLAVTPPRVHPPSEFSLLADTLPGLAMILFVTTQTHN